MRYRLEAFAIVAPLCIMWNLTSTIECNLILDSAQPRMYLYLIYNLFTFVYNSTQASWISTFCLKSNYYKFLFDKNGLPKKDKRVLYIFIYILKWLRYYAYTYKKNLYHHSNKNLFVPHDFFSLVIPVSFVLLVAVVMCCCCYSVLLQ